MLDSSADIKQNGRAVSLSFSGRSELWSQTLSKIQVWGVIALTFTSFFPTLFHYQEYAFFALFLAAAAMLSGQNRGIRWINSPIGLPFLLLVLWVLATVPFSIDPTYSFAEWRKLVAQLLVLSWVHAIVRAYGDAFTVRWILTAVVLGTAIVSAHSLIDFFQRGGSLVERNVRAWAPLAGPNWLSTYMVIAIPFVVVAGVGARNWWLRIICWAGVLGPALFAQALSYMRAGWIGLAVQGIALGVFMRRRQVVYAVLALCALIVLSLLILARAGYQPNTFDTVSMQIRLEIWNLGLREVVEHPLVGIGYGNDMIAKRFQNYPETIESLSRIRNYGMHSLFLMIAAGSGLPALVLIIWLLMATGRALLQGASHAVDPATYAFLIGTTVMIVGFAVRNMFDYMLMGSLAHLFWTLVAVALVQTVPKPVNDA